MDFTSRMTAFLRQMHRQRNGALAASMRLCGKPCGLNYGVSLPTVRKIARAESRDHDFARYLFRQDVRELRLAALHLADPARLAPDQFTAWAEGIINSELSEEAAFALLAGAPALPALFETWIASSDPLLCCAALHAASRSPLAAVEWLAPALSALRRFDTSAKPLVDSSVDPAAASGLIVQGATALCVALASRNAASRQAVLRAVGESGELPSEKHLREELEWLLA